MINLRHYFIAYPGGKLEIRVCMKNYLDTGQNVVLAMQLVFVSSIYSFFSPCGE